MRSVLVGAVEGTAVALETLCAAGHAPALVVTLPPEKAARHSDFADLAAVATPAGIPLHHTTSTSSAATLAEIRAVAPDVILVIGWSQLVGAEFRSLAPMGVLGFHPSPLPRMRGRAVIPWQILTGQHCGGATLFWIDEGTDSGPIAAQALFGIDPDTITARALYDRAVGAMADLLPPLMDALATGARPTVPQDEAKATLCARRRPEDGRIDWVRTAAEIDRLIRAVGPPYPGAVTGCNGASILVRSARPHSREGYHVALPGQVVNFTDGELTVMCGDGRCIDLTGWEGPRPPHHAMLTGGVDAASR